MEIGEVGTRLSKKFYLGSVAGALALSCILAIVGIIHEHFPAILLAALLVLFSDIVVMILFYKMWRSIQDGYARTSPRKAILLLFVPVFHLYWLFQVTWGFSKDYNAFVRRHSLTVPLMPERLFVSYAILEIIAHAQRAEILRTGLGLGVILMLVHYFVLLAMILKVCGGVNAISNPSCCSHRGHSR